MPIPPSEMALPAGPSDRTWWRAVASRVSTWAAEAGIELRDAVWLLPYSALLPLAREALAEAGGWQPRVETLATLRAQLGPRLPEAGPGQDAVLNRLQAAQWLREQPAGAAWAREDPRAFRQHVDALVRCAQALGQAAACQAPERRAAWWRDARAALAGGNGPGDVERQLARIALEWAAGAGALDADTLRALRVSAWVSLRAGGAEPLGEALLTEAAARGTPVLRLDADPPLAHPFALSLKGEPPSEALCTDAEAEAQAACAQILTELKADSDRTVALIAQDREGVRRVRALLERFGIPVVDDTGWRLATTRAAARLIAMLRAAQSLGPGRANVGVGAGAGAGAADQRLEWLKDDPLGLAQPDTVMRLEALWRGQRVSDTAAERARALWASAQERLAPLLGERRRPLHDWLARLATLCLADPAETARWRDDAAGRAVLLALRLEPPASQAEDWLALARQATMSLDDFVAWVDEVLADASFVPPHDSGARVVITPLARAMLRPFGAVVFPGTDERRLGAIEPLPELIPPAIAQALGLQGTMQQRERETLAFAQLLRQPHVILLRRVAEGDEALGASPLIERLRLAWAPRDLPRITPLLPTRTVTAQPPKPPLPQAGERWPDALSASAVEALRACPYRFFSRVLLGLGEADELDRAPAKRDYGNWLHLVLYRFHTGRTPGRGIEMDRVALREAAANEQAESSHTEADLLPFLASFDALVEPYLQWLARRESEGWMWWQGELDRRITPESLGGIALRGRLDRLDRGPQGALQLLDYKTGGLQKLKDTARDRGEDTQLAFYAALVAEEGPIDQLKATYLAMDDRTSPAEVQHERVGRTATLLLENLAGELGRLRAGEPLRALGAGALCDHCEARGLCRRDHWGKTE